MKLPIATCAVLALLTFAHPAESDCPPTNRPPEFVTELCGRNLEVPADQHIFIWFVASDPDPGDVVTLRVVELPNAAYASTDLPVSGAPASGEVRLLFARGDRGPHALVVEAVDPCGARTECRILIEAVRANYAPDCSAARASVARLWPPNHDLVAVSIVGITDRDFDPVVVTARAVTQDEPLASGGEASCPDAFIVDGVPFVRTERDGAGNGRFYRILFEATDVMGASCSGVVQLCVPRDMSRGSSCIEDDLVVVSTESCEAGAPAKREPAPWWSHGASRTTRIEAPERSTWGRVKVTYR